MLTMSIGVLFIRPVRAFMYNKYYTRRLLERGSTLAGSDSDNALAASAAGHCTAASDRLRVGYADTSRPTVRGWLFCFMRLEKSASEARPAASIRAIGASGTGAGVMAKMV